MMSFQAIKHLTTVDGGALFLKDKDDYKRAKLLRWYGIDRESVRKDMRCEEDIVEWGYKYHMNDVCATVGLGNFDQALDNGEYPNITAERPKKENLFLIHKGDSTYIVDIYQIAP